MVTASKPCLKRAYAASPVTLTNNQARFINAFLRGDVKSTTISGSEQLNDFVDKFQATGMEIGSIDIQNMLLK